MYIAIEKDKHTKHGNWNTGSVGGESDLDSQNGSDRPCNGPTLQKGVRGWLRGWWAQNPSTLFPTFLFLFGG